MGTPTLNTLTNLPKAFMYFSAINMRHTNTHIPLSVNDFLSLSLC